MQRKGVARWGPLRTRIATTVSFARRQHNSARWQRVLLDLNRDRSRDRRRPGYEIASRLIGQINALGRIHDPNFRRVTLSRCTDDNGQPHVFGAIGVTLVTVRMRATTTVTYADGTTPPTPPSPWPAYLTLAVNDLTVAEALEKHSPDRKSLVG
ncbi:hypothetical protein Mycsm_01232 [Mycobacterium sp. JS623]|nr:hypothetical protein Mycsm_01232 [Mycobacterium sp. JS623]